MALQNALALGPNILVGSLVDIESFLKKEAADAMAAYPQYAGFFDNYRLGRVRRTVRTKMGVAAEKGELVIFIVEKDYGAKVVRGVDRECATFWSRTNRVNTTVLLDTISEVK